MLFSENKRLSKFCLTFWLFIDKELNSFPFNQTNNNPSKKELNKSNNNTKIRLMIENNFYENNKGNHFAALSLNGETKSNH